tara:strand:- start:304 stop:504 length:201 start_codon:yes stop_codon:yes gene_type:complete
MKSIIFENKNLDKIKNIKQNNEMYEIKNIFIIKKLNKFLNIFFVISKNSMIANTLKIIKLKTKIIS